MSEHEHVWHGVGTHQVLLYQRDRKPPSPGVLRMEDIGTVVTLIIRACDCGEYYFQPVAPFDEPDRIRPWPEWAKRP